MRCLPLTEFAPAKINLFLHVTGRRKDGYHELQSLVAFADVGDQVSLLPDREFGLTISGPFAAGLSATDNLVLTAARWCATRYDRELNFALHLEKNLPHPAGIGGGSADAAGVIRLLERYRMLKPLEDPAVLAELGADVPVCYGSRAAVMEGIGEKVTPVDLPLTEIILINPGFAVPTGPVFGALKGRDSPAVTDPLNWQAAGNDLQVPATELHPQLQRLLDELSAREDVQLARMSGSGATCFVLPDGDAGALADRLQKMYPAYWIRQIRLK